MEFAWTVNLFTVRGGRFTKKNNMKQYVEDDFKLKTPNGKNVDLSNIYL
jgi:hypothetical protein